MGITESMKLLFLISVVYQNGIIANIIIQQLKDMQEQIDNLREAKVTLFADFEDQIANLTEKIATQAEQIAVQTDQIAYQATKIDIMQKQQEKIDQKFTDAQDDLKSVIGNISESMEEIATKPKPVVAFRATCAKNFPNSESTYYIEDKVIWKNIEFNIGSAFDSSTGTFICPHDGIYSFYATSPILDLGTIRIYVEEFMSNQWSEKVRHHTSSNYDAYGRSKRHISPYGEFKLRRGDTVHIQMKGNFYYASSDCKETYFQGHLMDLL